MYIRFYYSYLYDIHFVLTIETTSSCYTVIRLNENYVYDMVRSCTYQLILRFRLVLSRSQIYYYNQQQVCRYRAKYTAFVFCIHHYWLRQSKTYIVFRNSSFWNNNLCLFWISNRVVHRMRFRSKIYIDVYISQIYSKR